MEESGFPSPRFDDASTLDLLFFDTLLRFRLRRILDSSQIPDVYIFEVYPFFYNDTTSAPDPVTKFRYSIAAGFLQSTSKNIRSTSSLCREEDSGSSARVQPREALSVRHGLAFLGLFLGFVPCLFISFHLLFTAFASAGVFRFSAFCQTLMEMAGGQLSLVQPGWSLFSVLSPRLLSLRLCSGDLDIGRIIGL